MAAYVAPLADQFEIFQLSSRSLDSETALPSATLSIAKVVEEKVGPPRNTKVF